MPVQCEAHNQKWSRKKLDTRGDSMSDDDLLRAAKKSGMLDYFNDSGLDTVMSGELSVIRRFLDLARQPVPTAAKAEPGRAVEEKIVPPVRVARTWVDV
jgi:hypothetical protein